MIDTHCHLDVAEFAQDRQLVLQRARQAGVRAQIIPAIARRHWQAIAELCAAEPDCYAAYGLHPMYLAEHRTAHLTELASWLKQTPCVAIGEAGLDYFVEGLDANIQQQYLEAQLRLARDFDLPIVLHARKALDQITAGLRKFAIRRAVVHSFSGSPEQARALFKLGIHIGIGGPITYARAHRLQAIVAQMPLEFLLLETDAPDQPMCGRQGQRNEPSYLPQVLHRIAELRQISPSELSQQSTQNACTLFGLSLA